MPNPDNLVVLKAPHHRSRADVVQDLRACAGPNSDRLGFELMAELRDIDRANGHFTEPITLTPFVWDGDVMVGQS